MEIQIAYDSWAESYDQMPNKTRDLEGQKLKEILNNYQFNSVLEIGCGTGKNSKWFIQKAGKILAVDFSKEMLAIAQKKINSTKIEFKQADILKPWTFTNEEKFDLISFSLVLEHIQNLDYVFENIANNLNNNGLVYIGELHPFKQYLGSKARFETNEGTQILQCYTHNISEFFKLAQQYNLKLIEIKEFFDKNETGEIPRILALVFQKI